MTYQLRSRQIHLDFHTSPLIKDVAADFDAKEFARTMKRAHVNSVTVFAKCHHGLMYYNTKRPERHPGLKKNFDLLAAQIDALHREGIKAPIYISIMCDEHAAHLNPGWVCQKPDGTLTKWGGVFEPGWHILDMSSPYQEYLAEQTREILKLFKPVDGIFFDMCWDQISCSAYARAAMAKAGLDPSDEMDRWKHARTVSQAYMKRFHDMVKATSRDAGVFFNCGDLTHVATDVKFLAQVEIESLATGFWGHLYFPANIRYARRLGKECMGMTARFHGMWGDFGSIKPYAALECETAKMMAHGAKCSIGDQLHPRGTLDKASYELIGKTYKRMADREPWLEGARAAVDIGVFKAPAPPGNFPKSLIWDGSTRILTQIGAQFDVLTPADDLSNYRVLVLPDTIDVDAKLAARLRKYLKSGGKILASGFSGVGKDGATVTLPELGIDALGLSPYQNATYIRFGKRIDGDVPDTNHVMYEPGIRVRPKRGAQSLATVVEPYFDRAWNAFCSHKQTPDDRASSYSAAVLTKNTAYIPYPIFSAFAKHGNYPYRLLVRNLMRILLPDPLVKVQGPTGLEASVMRQKQRTIVHLLHYSPERRAENFDIIEDIIPLYQIPLSLRLPRPPKAVYCAPDRETLPFTWMDGRVEVLVPEVRGHEMIVFE